MISWADDPRSRDVSTSVHQSGLVNLNGAVMVRKIAFAVAMVLAGSLSAWAAETTGAGSTFVYPILSKWAADYALRSGNKVNYQPVGSGSGIVQIKCVSACNFDPLSGVIGVQN